MIDSLPIVLRECGERSRPTKWRALGRTLLIALVSLLGCAALSGTAQAANTNPIDWTVSTTIIGRNGEDLPLRVGQHDQAGQDGFGISHIQDGHSGYVPDPGLMQQAADVCNSNPDPNATTTCSIQSEGRKLIVVWTERIDSRAPDGRPVGIITAYFV